MDATATQKPRQPRRPRAPVTPEVRISKTMSWALRHGAEELKLDMRPSGYVPLAQLLRIPKLRGVTEAQVEEIVRTNDKKRYTITTDATGEIKYIRANQGHTLQIVQDDELLTPVEDPAELPQCIHGTYTKFWESILEGGLSRMTRNHIHMTPAEIVGGEVVSGMRTSCNLLLYIDHAKAMADGIKFYRSSNNVILSPGLGDSGVIDRKYFLKAVTISGKVVFEATEE